MACYPHSIYLKKIIIALAVFGSLLLRSQSLSGIIADSLQASVPFIPLALLNAKDSSIVKGTNTNDNGYFIFENINPGHYLIKIQSVGFKTKITSHYSIDTLLETKVGTIVLQSLGIHLDEVSISVIKNPIEFKGGNVIVNVEDSPLAVGNNAYDLIARLPGVMVENDNISILGKSGVKVFINDRILQMSGAQLVAFLRGLNAASIEKIEILNNPPARYDASGGAGIINIKTKRIKITGFSGGFNHAFSQGYFSKNVSGLTLNYKGHQVTFFSNFGFNEWDTKQESYFNKTVTFNSLSTDIKQRSFEITDGKAFNFDVGADWYINKKNTVGIKAQGLYGQALRTFQGNTSLSDNSIGYKNLLFTRPIENEYYWGNYNFNAEHLFDTLGTKLRFSTDYYGPYYDIYKGLYENRFLGRSGSDTLPPQTFKTNNYIGISILASRLDFEKTFSKNLSLETGIKQSYQHIRSEYTFENKNNLTGDYTIDSVFSNKFSYKEMISAAYFHLAKQIKKITIQVGLRGENTIIRATSLTNSIKYDRHYFSFFPLFSFDYNHNQKHSLSFAYNRRINRPDYNSFNPFRSFSNPLNSSQGNPYLLPVFDNNFSFNYVFKRKISNSISFSQSKNPIFGYASQNDSTKETIFYATNLKRLNIIRNNLWITHDLKKWWMMSFLVGAYYIDYTGKFNGLDYSTKAIPYYFRVNSFFTFKKEFKLEVSFFYWSPWLGGTNVYQHREGLSWAIRKSFLNKSLSVSIGMNDVFFTENFKSKADFQNQKWEYFDANDTRRFNVSLSYNFGKIKAQQRQTKENEEEKNRLH